jgi:hypothetical protein
LDKINRQLVGVAVMVDDARDTGVNDHFGTSGARLVRAVQSRPFDGYAVQGRLDDGILLGMQAPAELVALAGGNIVGRAETANIAAVGQSTGRAIVTTGKHAFIFNNNCAHLAAHTG